MTRIDPSLPLPEYRSAGAAGFDFVSRVDTTVAPHSVGLIPSNLIIAVPAGHVLLVSLRSSTPRRTGLIIPHGIGVIDEDYRGPADEIQIQVFNIGGELVTVRRGERIAQGLFVPVARARWEESEPDGEPSRGGFGSTGEA